VRSAVVIGALVALLAAGSAVDSSRAAFTAHEESTGSLSAAADWVAPALTLATPVDDSFQKTTTVSLSGAAGNAPGDNATVTVSVYSGSSATGSPVATRTVTRTAALWATTVTGLAQGTYTAQATQSDSGANTATSAASTFTIDTTAPTRVSVSAANGSGTAGHLDNGDTITFTYSEAVLASSILTGWPGTSAATVKVRFFSGTVDSFTVLDSAGTASLKLEAGTTGGGGVSLGSSANYVTNTVNFAATMSRSADGRSFTVTLGSPDIASRVVSTPVAAKNMTWTPKAGPTDLAANALTGVTAWTETDADRDF
jgi:hypothetical protein